MSKTCDQCAAENPTAANFCSRCGHGFGEFAIRSATRITPVMQQWRQLSHTMTRKEVRKLLGEPLQIQVAYDIGSAAVETWTYEYESTVTSAGSRIRGIITFNAAESRILAWTEPDWRTA